MQKRAEQKCPRILQHLTGRRGNPVLRQCHISHKQATRSKLHIERFIDIRGRIISAATNFLSFATTTSFFYKLIVLHGFERSCRPLYKLSRRIIARTQRIRRSSDARANKIVKARSLDEVGAPHESYFSHRYCKTSNNCQRSNLFATLLQSMRPLFRKILIKI